MRKFDLSLRSSRSSYFATFRHQLTILSKTDALDEEKWLNMLGTFVKDWFRYESHFVHGRDRKSGSAGMPRPISYAVFCLKKKNGIVAVTGVGGLVGELTEPVDDAAEQIALVEGAVYRQYRRRARKVG